MKKAIIISAIVVICIIGVVSLFDISYTEMWKPVTANAVYYQGKTFLKYDSNIGKTLSTGSGLNRVVWGNYDVAGLSDLNSIRECKNIDEIKSKGIDVVAVSKEDITALVQDDADYYLADSGRIIIEDFDGEIIAFVPGKNLDKNLKDAASFAKFLEYYQHVTNRVVRFRLGA